MNILYTSRNESVKCRVFTFGKSLVHSIGLAFPQFGRPNRQNVPEDTDDRSARDLPVRGSSRLAQQADLIDRKFAIGLVVAFRGP